jgi:hypothetical protein
MYRLAALSGATAADTVRTAAHAISVVVPIENKSFIMILCLPLQPWAAPAMERSMFLRLSCRCPLSRLGATLACYYGHNSEL